MSKWIDVTVSVPPSESRPDGVSLPTRVLELGPLRMPSEPGNKSARPLVLRYWTLPQRCKYVDDFMRLAEQSADPHDRVTMGAALFNDVWGPGPSKGQNRTVQTTFFWPDVIQFSGLADDLGITEERTDLVSRPVPDDSDEREEAVVAVEDALLGWAGPEEPNQDVLLRAFAPGLSQSTITPTDYVLHQMVDATIISHAALMQELGPSGPPPTDSPEDSSYRRRHRERIRRLAAKAGISAEEMSGFARWASFQAAVFWSWVNSYRMVAVHDAAHLDDAELELFRLMHVRTVEIGGGLLLPPILWDKVLASFVPSVSARFRERLVYVGCAGPGDFPNEWVAETKRLLVAYLKLYTVTVGELRAHVREKKSSGLKHPQGTRPSKNTRDALLVLNEGAAAGAGLGARLAKVRKALLELKNGGHTGPIAPRLLAEVDCLQPEVELADSSPEGSSHDALVASLEQLTNRVFKLLIGMVLRTSPKTQRIIYWLFWNSEAVTLDQVADEFGCSRPNISKMLIRARAVGQRVLDGMPACASLYLGLVRGLSPSTRGTSGRRT